MAKDSALALSTANGSLEFHPIASISIPLPLMANSRAGSMQRIGRLVDRSWIQRGTHRPRWREASASTVRAGTLAESCVDASAQSQTANCGLPIGPFFFKRIVAMNKRQTTSQKHAELKHVSKQAKDSMYQRLALTHEILSDHSYVDRIFGSEPRAIEVLEADEWSDFAQTPGLSALLGAYRASPEREKWEENRFDWAVMLELAKPPATSQRGDRVNWKAECEKLAERVSDLEKENKLLRDLLSERVVAK
jgi:hypothetical protein